MENRASVISKKYLFFIYNNADHLDDDMYRNKIAVQIFDSEYHNLATRYKVASEVWFIELLLEHRLWQRPLPILIHFLVLKKVFENFSGDIAQDIVPDESAAAAHKRYGSTVRRFSEQQTEHFFGTIYDKGIFSKIYKPKSTNYQLTTTFKDKNYKGMAYFDTMTPHMSGFRKRKNPTLSLRDLAHKTIAGSLL